MSQTFQPDDLINVQLRGVRYVRHEPDGALTIQTNDPDEHLWALPPQAAVERVAAEDEQMLSHISALVADGLPCPLTISLNRAPRYPFPSVDIRMDNQDTAGVDAWARRLGATTEAGPPMETPGPSWRSYAFDAAFAGWKAHVWVRSDEPTGPVDCCPDAAEEPAGPVSLVDAGPAGPIAPHGCDDCCAEPGEPHAWPGCPGAAANLQAEAAGETVEDAEVTP